MSIGAADGCVSNGEPSVPAPVLSCGVERAQKREEITVASVTRECSIMIHVVL